jgi:hypothetical protein
MSGVKHSFRSGVLIVAHQKHDLMVHQLCREIALEPLAKP